MVMIVSDGRGPVAGDAMSAILTSDTSRSLCRSSATLALMSSRTLSPHVVIIGGFLTEPLNYRPLRRRLLARGAARVTIAPVHLPDWAGMGMVGMGPLLLRGARAIREARRASPTPLLVIGHSMGGVIARLAIAPVPFEGRYAGVADDVGCLVTLGTPHRFQPSLRWRHPGVLATEHLQRVAPVSRFAPTTAHLTVGSTLANPARRGPLRSLPQLLNRVLLGFVGETPGVRGDGLVGDDLSQLAGAQHIRLPDALHGVAGAPWYGGDELIDRWWPNAVAAWQQALAARAELDEDEARPALRPAHHRGREHQGVRVLPAAAGLVLPRT
jgi:hypothetical protein